VIQLGYPTYFLVILGIWNMLGAAALLAPRFPLLKEWAYAGAFFAYSGAIVSHVITGKGMPEVWVLTALVVLTAASWALRPAARRLDRWS
jgi:predicted metal-binding membrane protein